MGEPEIADSGAEQAEFGFARESDSSISPRVDEGGFGFESDTRRLQVPPLPDPPFPKSAIEAAVSEAYRLGKPVFVHPNSDTDVMAAVRGGVDIIAHTTPRSGPWDETVLAAMKKRRVALTPTLTLWKSAMRHDRL